MRKVFYTFIFDDYDNPKEIERKEGWEYYMISDKPQEGWETIIDDSDLDPRLKARKALTCPHFYFDYDLCVSVGGQIEYWGELPDEIDTDLVVWEHPDRNCIYEEAKAVIRLNKDTAENVLNKVYRFKDDGFPTNQGMIATGFMIRRWSERMKRFSELWWDEVQKDSFRDQLAFNYVLWKHPVIEYKTIEFAKDSRFNKHLKRVALK